MEVLGLHLPGASFTPPTGELREALTRAAAARVTELAGSGLGIGEIVDERAIVNACVALLASGGSTNHTMHLVAIARAAGIQLTWDDFSELSAAVPLLARVYPNGQADVNHFHAAGGIGYLIRTLLSAGLLHEEVETIVGPGLSRYTQEPRLAGSGLGSTPDSPGIEWVDGVAESGDLDVLRPATEPFSPDGGLRVLHGPIGTAVIKTSAVKPENQVVTAPAVVFDDQADFLSAFGEGRLDHDLVAVIRYQGPAANGMPELHKLTPALGVLQDRGRRVAIVTDGRMSGASGKVPAAIHVTPEAALGGPLARVRDGDLITVDAVAGTLTIDVAQAELDGREATGRAPIGEEWAGTGRELFGAFRAYVGTADTGASVFAPVSTHSEEPSFVHA
jgi:phosphogluconate dehydratase